MKTKKDVSSTFFIFCVIFCSLVTYFDIIRGNNTIEITTFANLDVNTVDPPIYINSNEEFRFKASTRHWRGNGSFFNPIVISNRVFGSNPVRISNTDVHFLIVNNIFVGSNDAIDLRNVENGVLYNNLFTNSFGKSILLTKCESTKIIQNNISGSNQNGIKVVDTNNVAIERNLIHYSGSIDQSAIYLENTLNSKIFENSISNCPGQGISLNDCSNCTLAYNDITKNVLDSIYLHAGSQNCTVLSNYLLDNDANAMFFDSSSNNIISNNIITSAKGSGISLTSSALCSISGNRIDRCVTGIKIVKSHNGYIFDNEIIENRGEGIFIDESNNTVISSNIIIGNVDYGISFNNCGNNSFMWNDIFNNIDLNNFTIQGYSNNMIEFPHHLSNNYWGKNSSDLYLLDGNANTNDSNPQINSVQLLSHLNLAPVGDNEILFGQVMSLEWDIGEGSNWNLSYSVFLSTDGGHQWNNPVSNTRNLACTVDFADVPSSYQCVIKIMAWSANGVSKIGYSDQFSHYNSTGKILFHSPSNAQVIRLSSTISWDFTSDFDVLQVFFNIYFSKNNITWLLVEAQVFGGTLNWNTLIFEDGEYFLKISTHTYYGLIQENLFTGKFYIDNHYLNPDPALIAPREGEILKGTVFLSWTESFDSKEFPVSYDLYYSSIEGWVEIEKNITSPSYTWDTTTVRDGSNYRLRTEARGGLNEAISYETKFSFTVDNITSPPLETAVILVLVVAVAGLISVVYLLRKRLTAAELALKVKELKIGFCLGTFTDKGIAIRQKSEECTYKNSSLLSSLEYGAVLVQRSKYGIIYGPFPHPPDQDGIDWYNVVYGFKILDSKVVDSRIIQQQGKTPALLLIYYPRQFDVLFMLQKRKIEDYLGKILNESDIDDLLLRGFDIIYEKVRQILLDYKPLEMDLVLKD